MRLLTTICVTALVVAFCMPAFAETQNVKISGDIAVAHIFNHQLDLDKDDNDGAGAGTSDSDQLFTQIIGLNVDADLTDNVSTYVRLVSQRDWNDVAGNSDDFQVNLDEAFITLKEMLYAPLTVKIGRQNLWFGKGFIIGNNTTVWDDDGTMRNDELSDLTAFDAIRGTLDYDPWTIDLVYAKIDENTVNTQDDIDLYGLNLGYLFDRYEAEAEAYVWHKHDQANKPTTDTNEVTTVGLRGSFVPYDNMNIYAEGDVQLGRYHDTTFQAIKNDREAWALDIGGDYAFPDVKWTPTLGIEYIYLSGDGADTTTGDYEGWDSMYTGKFDSLIRAYMDQASIAYAQTDRYSANNRGRTAGTTNQNQIKIYGSLDLMEDLILDADFSYFWFDEPIISGVGDDEIGAEVDGYLTYDYTEDVQFKVAAGIFFPDDAYESVNSCDDTAAKVISSVKVEF